MTYPHPRPTPPAQLYGLAALAGVGLLALWITAYTAFIQVGGVIHALAAASLIEAALVLSTIFIIRHWRSRSAWFGVLGVVISIIVSGTYNYLSAEAHAPETMTGWPLLTLAIGPLAALLFIAFEMAHELHTYQQAVETWQQNRADWLENLRKEAEAERKRKEAEVEAWRREQQEAERERQTKLAEARLQLEREEAERRWKSEEAARKRAERRRELAAGNLPEKNKKAEIPAGNLPEWLGKLPANKRQFMELCRNGEIITDGLTGADLAAHIPAVSSDRTGRNWLAAVSSNGHINGKD